MAGYPLLPPTLLPTGQALCQRKPAHDTLRVHILHVLTAMKVHGIHTFPASGDMSILLLSLHIDELSDRHETCRRSSLPAALKAI